MTLSADVLERAGIHVTPAEFDRFVLAAVDRVTVVRLSDPQQGLTREQIDEIRKGGIDPLTAPSESFGSRGPVSRAAADYAALLATGLSVPETARVLHVDQSRVRQRIRARTLYAIKSGATWRVLVFQFFDNRLVPGIDCVLPRLGVGLSPLTVTQWFRRPSPNLVTDDGTAWSPLDWLLSGHPIGPVVEAAEGLGWGE